jgi:hypothetical protein
MPTSPASVPFEVPVKSHSAWPDDMSSTARRMNIVETVPAAAASVVLTAQSAATVDELMIASALPGLKPYLQEFGARLWTECRLSVLLS